MRITICGSMSAYSKMTKARVALEALGYDVELPQPDTVKAVTPIVHRGLIDEHFRKIDQSDAILVVNRDKNGIANYIGGSTLMEITYAYASRLEVFVLNPLPDVSYRDEMEAMQPIVLDGDVQNLHTYMQGLPKLHISSQSPVKHTALSRALRRVGVLTLPVGYKTTSGVSEQPQSVDESYTGALNRHANLKQVAAGKPGDFYATIESGLHQLQANHNVFGCEIVIVEPHGAGQKIGIDVNLEFPRAMTDMVPSKYPDMGVLVQQEYGAVLKDPIPFFTGGRLSRATLLENAAYGVAVQIVKGA